MTNLVRAAKGQAAQLVRDAYEAAAGRGLLPAGREVPGAVETPRDGQKGDFASSFAIAGAEALGMGPRQAAGIILEHLKLEGSFFQRAEVSGPGYINFFCSPRWYGGVLAAAEQLPPAPFQAGRPLTAPPAEARRRAWEDALANLLRRTGTEALPAPAGVGPVLLLREGRPAPGGDWAQAGEDALRFFLTQRPIAQPVELDIDLAARQDGGNPLYYVRYTHQRICALISNMAERGIPVPACGDIDPALLSADEELALVKALARYPEEIRLAAGRSDPGRVGRYLIALSGETRRFYQARPLDGGDAALGAARLKLADCARLVLADGLGVLGVSAPERCGPTEKISRQGVAIQGKPW